jgi:hypothetical protein
VTLSTVKRLVNLSGNHPKTSDRKGVPLGALLLMFPYEENYLPSALYCARHVSYLYRYK